MCGFWRQGGAVGRRARAEGGRGAVREGVASTSQRPHERPHIVAETLLCALKGAVVETRRVIQKLLLLMVLGCTACQTTRGVTQKAIPTTPDPQSERMIAQGRIVGVADSAATQAWVGVPFAEPPVGPLRWRAPVPPAPWQGVREATHVGEACPQFAGALAGSKAEPGTIIGSEDCLTLNVWAPRFEPGAVPSGPERLPVMLWIHGGGNTLGTASFYWIARNLAAEQRVIIIAPNYRLGMLGWFHHPALYGAESSAEDRSGNYGTLDLIRALEWVKENAAAFGGDPGNVTIFGESAGGMNVFSLLVSPKAKGLFHRAISQSGLPSSASLVEASHLVDEAEPGKPGSSAELLLSLLQQDGSAKDRAAAKAQAAGMSAEEISRYLRKKTPQELLAPFAKGSRTFGMYRVPNILRDGTVLPKEPFLEVLGDSKRYNAVPTVVGTNRDEMKLFMAGDPDYVGKLFGLIPHIKDVAKYNRLAAYMSDVWKALGADLPANRMRAAQGPSVYAYRFDWDEEPMRGPVDLSVLLGAAHGLEISFVFREFNADLFGINTDANLAGRQEVSAKMASYWTEFAKSGSPGKGRDGSLPEWKPWDNSSASAERMIIFDTTAGGGTRMSSQQVSVNALVEQLAQEAALKQAPLERCWQLAQGLQFMMGTGAWREEDFKTLGGGMCRDYTMQQALSASFP